MTMKWFAQLHNIFWSRKPTSGFADRLSMELMLLKKLILSALI